MSTTTAKPAFQHHYLLRCALTKKYWTGEPAPNAFQGTREEAESVTWPECAFIRATYVNVEYEVFGLQSEDGALDLF